MAKNTGKFKSDLMRRIRIAELNAQYRIVSECLEEWQAPSQHRIYLKLDRKLGEILKELESLHNQKQNESNS